MITLMIFLVAALAQGGEVASTPLMGQSWPELKIDFGNPSTGVQNGIQVMVGQAVNANLRPADLLDLLFRADTFAGLAPFVSPPSNNHEAAMAFVGSTADVNLGFSDPGAKRASLGSSISIYATATEANSRMNAGFMHAQATDSRNHRAALPHLGSLGIDFWFVHIPGIYSVSFQQGKTVSSVDAYGDRYSSYFIEAVSLGTWYRILRHPDLAEVDRRVTKTIGGHAIEGIQIENDAYVPVSTLTPLGISAKRDGYDTVLTLGTHWERITPFTWTVKTDRGDSPVLASFNGNDGLVVPLDATLSALGMKP